MNVGDLADPDIFQENGVYYAYGTSIGGRNVPLVTSTDLVHWTTNKQYTPSKSEKGRIPENAIKDPNWYNDSLALPGTWAQQQSNCNTSVSGCYEIWAPSVEKAANGKYVMAYATRVKGNPNKFAIGIATSDKLTGPFYDDSAQPLVKSDTDPKGVIDPDLYKDPSTGDLYLYWKNEGNDKDYNNQTRIHVQKLNSSGTGFDSKSPRNDNLLSNQNVIGSISAASWTGKLIENPSMVKWNNQYYLFYSGNDFETTTGASAKYAVGYAKCSGPTGPCTHTSTPVLSTNNELGLIGPGGASAFTDKTGAMRFIYAAWTRAGHANYDNTCDIKRSFWGGTKNACVADQRYLRVATVGTYGANKMLAVTQKASNLANPAFTVSQAAAKSNQAKTFTDYTSNDQFAAEMNWLGATGITTGYSDGTYHPLEAINRNAMAAYLYRMAGSPSFTAPAVSPFTDVHPGDPFYKEITWMRSVGITTGYGDGSFHPYEKIHRDAMATFLYRMAGRPAYSAPSTSAFTDIKPGDQFYKEVSWAASQGITTGWSVNGGKAFRPLNNINRDAMAAFVYRMASKGWVVAY